MQNALLEFFDYTMYHPEYLFKVVSVLEDGLEIEPANVVGFGTVAHLSDLSRQYRAHLAAQGGFRKHELVQVHSQRSGLFLIYTRLCFASRLFV